MPFSDLPEPKYTKGQTLWHVNTERHPARYDCPDCLGTKVWNVETPGGLSCEVPCQRCGSGYTYTSHDEIVPLAYTVYVAAPRSIVVTDIEIRTRGSFGDGPSVSYNGYSEGGLYDTEEAARAASQAQADDQNAKQAATPERLAQKNIGRLRIDEAKYDQFANGLWNAWYAYNSLCEKLDEYLEDKETLSRDDTRYLKDDIRWETEYRAKQDRPLDQMVAAVRAALDGDASLLQAAYDALPGPLKREAPAKLSEVFG